MLRFIDINKQCGPYAYEDPENLWPREFAFFDTDTRYIPERGGQ
jgi:hypothetical protein